MSVVCNRCKRLDDCAPCAGHEITSCDVFHGSIHSVRANDGEEATKSALCRPCNGGGQRVIPKSGRD